MTATGPTVAGPLETRLFRLCIVLKAAFWIALVAVLGKVLWTEAMGQEHSRPLLMIGIVLALALLQFVAMLVWWRVRNARRQQGSS